MQHDVWVVWSKPERPGARRGLLQVRAGSDAVAHIMFTAVNEAGSAWITLRRARATAAGWQVGELLCEFETSLADTIEQLRRHFDAGLRVDDIARRFDEARQSYELPWWPVPGSHVQINLRQLRRSATVCAASLLLRYPNQAYVFLKCRAPRTADGPGPWTCRLFRPTAAGKPGPQPYKAFVIGDFRDLPWVLRVEGVA